MVSNVPHTILYYNNPASPIDITKYAVSANLKLQGTGRIRSATIMLNASEGQFIANSSSGATPILSKFDRIKIFFTDDNGNIKSAICEVDQNLKQINEGGKTLLPVELLGKERSLRDIKVRAFYKFKSARYVINDLAARYNAQRGTSQPAWALIDPLSAENFNLAPDNINNVYDFVNISYYDAVMMVINRLNQPTDLVGSGTFYSLIIEDNESLPGSDLIIMKIHEQGTTVGSIPTIASSENDPFHKVTTQIHTPTGTQVFVQGTQETGTMPPDLHKFSSYVETINNFPPYDPTTTYQQGIRVNVSSVIYEAIGAVPISTPPPNALYWVSRSVTDIINAFIAAEYPAYQSARTYGIGSRVSFNHVAYEAILTVPISTPPPNATFWKVVSINYSLWTNNKALVTKNSCSNPDQSFNALSFQAPAFPDGNLVIRDRIDPTSLDYKFYRDFVWCRAKNPADIISDPRMKQYLMGSSKNTFYNGFTVLVDKSLGALGGVFAGSDRFGVPFGDSIAQYDGTQWIVSRVPAVGDEAAVYIEGKNYEYNVVIANPNLYFGNAHDTQIYSPKYRGPNGATAWRDVSGTVGGNDCWHAPSKIEVVDGLIPKIVNGQDYSNYRTNSALKITYSYYLGTAVYQAGKALLDKMWTTVSKFFEGLGKGDINLEFTLTSDDLALPFETQWYNYGWWYALPFPYPFSTFNSITETVGKLYGGNDATAIDFAALDIQNSNYSHSGLTGFNHDEVSDMGGPFTGLKFWFQFDILIEGVRQLFQGNLPFTLTIYDDLRNVWRADSTYRLLGDPQEINIPFSSFTVTRPSRTPFHIASLSDIIDVVAVAEIQLSSIFEQKRVRLITIQFGQAYDEYLRYMPVSLDRFIRTQADARHVDFVGIIDGLALTKAPFVSSGAVDDRVINPDVIDAANVRNYIQLKSIAIAEQQLASLPFEQFTVVRNGSCDLTLEQSVYLQNQDLINESDKPATANTRKLILMTDELSWDAINGFLRTMTLTKRLGGP